MANSIPAPRRETIGVLLVMLVSLCTTFTTILYLFIVFFFAIGMGSNGTLTILLLGSAGVGYGAPIIVPCTGGLGLWLWYRTEHFYASVLSFAVMATSVGVTCVQLALVFSTHP